MKQERRQQILENIIYLIVWAILFSVPILGFKYNKESVDWDEVFHAWQVLVPFFAVFAVNNYLLMPFLLFRKRPWAYSLSAVALICAVFLCNAWRFDRDRLLHGDRFRNERVFAKDSMPFDRLEPRPMEPKPEDFNLQRQQPDMEDFPPMQPGDFRPPGPIVYFSPFLGFLLMSLLVISVNAAIKLMFKMIHDNQKMKELEKQNLQTELEYLKHQINPHFFMNTLNNIHALIDIDSEKAKETVIDLSKMMRYVLYDTSQARLPLAKEIQFLANYIELMKLRYTDQVDIRVHFPDEIPNVQIPPLLFISFLENAFKHGVSYRRKSFIDFSLGMKGGKLECAVENSKSKDPAGEQKQSGIGLENVKKRLRLLYNGDYTLQIFDKEDKYRVLLIIPV